MKGPSQSQPENAGPHSPAMTERPPPSGQEREFFTVVFKGDIRAFRGNPYTTETPFGRPHAIGLGNAFTEIDRLERAQSPRPDFGAERSGAWVLVPSEPTPEMLRAAREASIGNDPHTGEPLPVWDNWETPGNSADAKLYWRAVTGFTPSHSSYDWPEWQEAVLKAAYRAMLATAPLAIPGR